MADDAIATLSVQVLPDEIAKTITGSTSITPASGDRWYYKLSSVTNTSTVLIDADVHFVEYEARADGAGKTVSVSDKVKFIFIKNTDTTNDVYIVADGGTAASAAPDAIKIAAGHSWFGSLPNTTCLNLNAVTSSGTVTCVVVALLEDVA
jgi:hypothetical protein